MDNIRKAYADASVGQVHYRYVEANNGIPIVFFHRAPATSISFVPIMELMAGERPLYAFDGPGFGNSFDPPEDTTMENFGRWMLEAMDDIGIDEFHIFAHHSGTHYGTEMAAICPSRIKSLMLNGIAYLTSKERVEQASKVKKPVIPDATGEYLASTCKMIQILFPEFDPDLVHNEMIGALQSHFSRHKSFRAIWKQDYPSILAKVSCPVLATCAENEVWRFCFERVFRDRPDAKRVILGPSKFCTPELDAHRTVDVIREFLAEVEGASKARTQK